MIRALASFLLLAGCTGPAPEPKDTGSADADTDVDADTDSDSGEPSKDGDNDGFDTTTDCDDANYRVFPGATETCNGVDDDCDGAIDNGFDADADGQQTTTDFPTGTDCNDADPTIYAGAPEVPYDSVDQDCDGADLTDVDGDKYGWLDDCDDNDAEVNPNQTEIPKNGKDDDCVGGDSADADLDGYVDEDFGGDDCDDTWASVHPGARDLWNDGIDADCDGLDSRVVALADAPVSIVGETTEQGLVGSSVAFCDLDEDGLDDLVVTAPFADSYAGRVGIWYGSASASWGPDMAMTDADSLITSTDSFLGFELACDDVNGDGHLDLVTTRGELNAPSYGYDTTFEVLVWYGTGAAWASSLSESDVGTRFAHELGVPVGELSVYHEGLTVGDLDGDGAAEILVNHASSSSLTEPTGLLLVVQGKAWNGRADLLDSVVASLDPGVDGAGAVHVLGDENADGTVDLCVGSASWRPAGDTATDTATTADTGGGDTGAADGRGFFASSSLVDAAIADLAWRTWTGRAEDRYGWDAAVADFDADGADDAAVVALGFNDYAGALYIFSGLPAAGSPNDANAELLGSTAGGYFGYLNLAVDDADGDGARDLLVTEALGGSGMEGTVWLVSGQRAMSGAGDAESAALLAWSGEEADARTGYALAAGDSDGDGAQEYAIGAQTWADGTTTTYGKLYLLR